MRNLHPAALLPIILLVPVLGWVAFWFFSAKAIQTELTAWTETQRQNGYQISYAPPKLTGFPMSVDLSLDNVRIVAPNSVGGWSFSSATLRLKAAPYDFGRIRLIPGAPTNFIPPRESGLSPMTLTGGDARLAFSLNGDGGLDDIALDLNGAQIRGLITSGVTTIGSLKVTSQTPNFTPPADAKTVTNRIDVEGSNIILPSGAVKALSQKIAYVAMRAEVLGEIGRERLVFALKKWRDANGSINVPVINLEWDPMNVQASGAFALNNDLQPSGALNASFQGFFEGIAAMEQNRLIRAKDASMARLVLGALAKPAPNGGKPIVSLPFSLQARRLYAGPVPLYDFPQVSWGDAAVPGEPLTPGLQINPDGTLQPGIEIKPSGEVINID